LVPRSNGIYELSHVLSVIQNLLCESVHALFLFVWSQIQALLGSFRLSPCLRGMVSSSNGLLICVILMRPCSVVPDWSPELIPNRITYLIYIDFDELE
jgi:hypothetical protein